MSDLTDDKRDTDTRRIGVEIKHMFERLIEAGIDPQRAARSLLRYGALALRTVAGTAEVTAEISMIVADFERDAGGNAPDDAIRH